MLASSLFGCFRNHTALKLLAPVAQERVEARGSKLHTGSSPAVKDAEVMSQVSQVDSNLAMLIAGGKNLLWTLNIISLTARKVVRKIVIPIRYHSTLLHT